ncbi:MAG: GNAT family N-acetyltransferase [Candidatus Bipolaricaulota bacterium]|nr:GNAT family N-acetyltransferase [Candidatus Bipolaricaulota bacterium]
MKLSMRPYRNEDDYWAIRQFLRDVYLRNGRTEHSWQAGRLDWWRWHGILNMGDGNLETDIFLWETPGGELAAVLNCEGRGHVFLQVDPRIRTLALEEEMLTVAEQSLVGVGKATGRPFINVNAQDGDAMRTELLARRGHVRRADWQQIERKRELSLPIPDVPIAEGYTIRAMNADDEDLKKRSWASWRSFHPNEPDENYEGWAWLRSAMHAPMYRRDLDIVAKAPTGEVAAFATVWYDDVTRATYCEPVGTMPEHQRRGLAKAVIAEGMRRSKEMGALIATVGGGGASNPPAESLYAGMFQKDGVSVTGWLKYLDGKP